MASVDGESCGDGSERKIGDSPVSGESNSEDAVGNSEGVQRPEKPLSHAARRSCRREMGRKEKKKKKAIPTGVGKDTKTWVLPRNGFISRDWFTVYEIMCVCFFTRPIGARPWVAKKIHRQNRRANV